MPGRHQPLNMLVIEDNPGDAVLFQAFFKHSPRKTFFHLVHDGEEALAFLRRQPPFEDVPRPDLIIVDINIPKIDGKEVVREIKQDTHLRSIPAIVLTSSENEEDVRQCYELGANCVLIKAADVDQAARTFELIESFWVNTVRLARPEATLLPMEERARSRAAGRL